MPPTDPAPGIEARPSDRAGATLDIVIPVYNEGRNILKTLAALDAAIATPARILICYDFEEDDTLATIREGWRGGLPILFVRNTGRGAHGAVLAGFAASTAPHVLMYPADDDYNAAIVDRMAAAAEDGNDIVCACRFMPGGGMVDCPWLKDALVRISAFTLHYLAGVPTRDSSNGFRLFSRRVIDTIAIQSTRGFTYSIELLVKVHRLGWPVADVPARWFERTEGESRFKVLNWLGAYLKWYRYAFATTYLRRGPGTVTRIDPATRTTRARPRVTPLA